MSITEYQRHQLFTWFEQHMDKERATTMMSMLPPVGWTDVATARDVDALGTTLRAELRAEIAALRDELHTENAMVRHDIAAMEARLSRTITGWLFASQAAVIGAMGVLLATIR